MQRCVGLVRAGVRGTFVFLLVDPDAARRVHHRHFERELRAGRLENASRNAHIDELDIRRHHAHRAPLARGLERRTQQRGDVAPFRLANVGVDALLRELVGVLELLFGDVDVELVHADIEQLIVGDLFRGLDGIDLRERLGFVDHAATHQQEETEGREPFQCSLQHTHHLILLDCSFRLYFAFFLYSTYSFQSFSFSSGSVSASAALRRRRATTSSSLPSGIGLPALPGAPSPLPPLLPAPLSPLPLPF